MDKRDLTGELRQLLARIDALAVQLQRSKEENRSLRQQHEQMAGERALLLAKQEQARTRVEAMIGRLKSLEQHT
jgi:cell division protein ZapB